ncbi:MAG: hypothetical protein A2073_01975 [Deltaproteobacteria bacterium GWC2_42_11]|nr:MAG: hypothetical protein A2073_01975 [Deltaproteobacteria bacterium GWC2_42_11]
MVILNPKNAVAFFDKRNLWPNTASNLAVQILTYLKQYAPFCPSIFSLFLAQILRLPRKIKTKYIFRVNIVLILLLLVTPSLAATVTGRVEVTGEYGIKPGKKLHERVKAERALVVSRDGGLKNAVVSIEGVKGVFYPPKEQPVIVIGQKEKTFIPHVLPILVGTMVRFGNSDDFVHRIISDSEAKHLRLEFSYKGAAFDVTFDMQGVVRLWCDDHRMMEAWVLVKENPYFAVTDDNGNFTISNLPPGRYTIEVWHEVIGTQRQEVAVEERGNVKVDFKLQGKEF